MGANRIGGAIDTQLEAARTKVRNMLHAADHGNHLGEMAVLRMAASGELVERLQAIIDWADLALCNPGVFDSHGVRNLDGPVFDEARAALSLAQPYEAVEAVQPAGDA